MSRPTLVGVTNPYAKAKTTGVSSSSLLSISSSTSASATTRRKPSEGEQPHQQQQQHDSMVARNTSADRGNGDGGGMEGTRTMMAKRPIDVATTAKKSTTTTFSQAFESIEDCPQYKDQLNKEEGVGQPHQEALEDRAQQRALDAEGVAEIANTAPVADRDCHVLLQPHVLYISTRQRGNGLINFIRNVPYAYSKMTPDYVMGTTRCALFLSCRYHSLYPNYIHTRIAELQRDFALRVLLVLVDVQDHANAILFLNKLAVTHNLTLILAWSEEEAARYLETYRAMDGRDASLIQKKEKTHFGDQVADFLTSCKAVNKTDAGELLDQFGTVKSIMSASVEELALVSGMGQVKVRRLHDAFHKPFSKTRAAKRKREQQQCAQPGTPASRTTKEL